MSKHNDTPESLTDLPNLPNGAGGEASLDMDFTKETEYAQAIEQGLSQTTALPPSTDQTQVAAPTLIPTGLSGMPASAPSLAMPAIADDNDLIEKEWVLKAKQIVEHTKHDPYVQNNEMSKIKADYLKKRYNKDLKASP